MPSSEECKDHAAECKALAKAPGNSSRRINMLLNIARSWTALAHQLETLASIQRDETARVEMAHEGQPYRAP